MLFWCLHCRIWISNCRLGCVFMATNTFGKSWRLLESYNHLGDGKEAKTKTPAVFFFAKAKKKHLLEKKKQLLGRSICLNLINSPSIFKYHQSKIILLQTPNRCSHLSGIKFLVGLSNLVSLLICAPTFPYTGNIPKKPVARFCTYNLYRKTYPNI